MTTFALGHPLYPHNSTLVRTNKPRVNAGNFSPRYTDNQKSGTGGTFQMESDIITVRINTAVATGRGPQRPARSTRRQSQTPERDARARRQSETPERDASATKLGARTGGQTRPRRKRHFEVSSSKSQLVSRTSNHPPPSRTAKQLKAQQYRALAPVERTG